MPGDDPHTTLASASLREPSTTPSTASSAAVPARRPPSSRTLQTGAVLVGEGNYKIWRVAMQGALGQEAYLIATTGSAPADFSPEETRSFDGFAASLISSSIDVSVLPLLADVTVASAHTYWTALERVYAPTGAQESLRLINDFLAIPTIPTTLDAFDNWTLSARATINQMVALKIDLATIVSASILSKAPAELASFRAALDLTTVNDAAPPTFEAIVKAVRHQLRRPTPSSSATAYAAAAAAAPSSHSRPRRSGDRFATPPTTPCEACHKGNHWVVQCTNEALKEAWFEAKRKGGRPAAKLQPARALLANTVTAAAPVPAPLALAAVAERPFIGMVAAAFLSALPERSSIFLLDSAASHTMVHDRSAFATYSPCMPTDVGGIGGRVQAVGTGTVRMVTSAGTFVELSNVLHMPALPANLISLGYLANLGINTFITKGQLSLTKAGVEIGTGSPHSGSLFKFDATLLPRQSSPLAYAATTTSALTLHRRFGHLSMGALKDLARSGKVTGMAGLEETSSEFVCNGCCAAKAHRLPFPRSNSHASARLELVHSDVLEFPHPSLSGRRYLVTFLDDYTRRLWGFAITRKSDVYETFRLWKLQVENETGQRIKGFRSDNGGEYLSSAFVSLLEESGIDHSFTVPYTPEQNGRAERANLSIVEGVLAMLHDSGLPRELWAEAASTFIDVKNLCPHAGIRNKIPNAQWFSLTPDTSALRAFGCRAWMTVHHPHRDKLNDKAVPRIFVGYAKQEKAYRLYDPATSLIVISRNVKFVEHEFPLAAHSPAPLLPPSSASTPPSSAPAAELAPEDSDSNSSHGGTPALESWEQDMANQHTDNYTPSVSSLSSDSRESTGQPSPSLPPPAACVPRIRVIKDEGHDREDTFQLSPPPPRDPYQTRLLSRSLSAPAPARRLAPLPTRRSPRLASESPDPLDLLEPSAQYADLLEAMDQPLAFAVKVDTAFGVVSESFELPTQDPRNYREAMRRPDALSWREACESEFHSLLNKYGCLEPVPLSSVPASAKILGSQFALKRKQDSSGTKTTYKGRLVARGDAQRPGLDFSETFAPVAKFTSIRALLALAAAKGLKVQQADVDKAYLHGDLDEELYMRAPQGVEGYEGQVFRLRRSLYGLKQAGRAWNQKLDASLLALGYKQCVMDNCVYVRDMGKDDCHYIAVYVDDLLMVGHSDAEIERVLTGLETQYGMKRLGNAEYILGIQIIRGVDGSITLSQRAYLVDILARFDMTDCKAATTPMEHNLKLLPGTSPASAEEVRRYLSALGSLMYANLGTRPDLSHAVSYLCRFSAHPDDSHWTAIKHILRYVKGTLNLGLRYTRTEAPQHGLIAYSDSDWGNDLDTSRSTMGYSVHLAGAAISWSSKLQSRVADSTCDAEYIGLSHAAKEVVFIRQLLGELSIPLPEPTTLLGDNQGANAIARNPTHHQRSRHVRIREHFVRDMVRLGDIVITYIATADMVADIFTKSLSPKPFLFHREGLGIRSAF